jgi:hypothetical protein
MTAMSRKLASISGTIIPTPVSCCASWAVLARSETKKPIPPARIATRSPRARTARRTSGS